jgi:HK97 family phage portal protein
MVDRLSTILDANARPFSLPERNGNGRARPRISEKDLLGYLNSYLDSLASIQLPAITRARDPFRNHAWVFAAAVLIASVASQAPFLVFHERGTPDGRRYRAGKRRTAILRRHRLPALFRQRGAEPDFDHPISQLLNQPNPYQRGNQLIQTTHLWMALRGEAFWVLERGPNGLPVRIWPISPDCFEPILTGVSRGELIGWWYLPPEFVPEAASSRRIRLDLDDVIQFKRANPRTLVRGQSRLDAVAESVLADLKIRSSESRLLDRQAVPKGVIESDAYVKKEEREAFLQEWQEQFGGSDNQGGTAFLPAGFVFKPLSLSPKDMQHLQQLKWDREEILAVMGVPQSVLGITDFVNYATQLGQDKNLWDKTILPMFRDEETTLEWSPLFAPETDDTFGMFELKDIEALRAGVDEKIKMADQLAGERLHCPPRVAYQVVGLEVPEYEGDEVCLVGSLATPLDVALSSELPEEEDPPEDPPEPVEPPAEAASRAKAPKRRRTWKEFVKVQSKLEGSMRRAYRAWIDRVQKETLRRFDRETKQLDLEAVLPDPAAIREQLKGVARPVYSRSLQQAYALTLEEIGIPTFEIDDERLMAFFDVRERRFLSTTPERLLKNLRNQLTEGLRLSETVQELRVRVARVFEISASSAKALAVARTETAGFVNGARDVMFRAQGFGKHEWVSAGDENVRDSHVTYGAAGPQDIGFNFMTLTGGGGVLRHPGDVEAPVGETVNCRCLAVPIE